MPEDALVTGQGGQPASPEPQGGTVTEQGGTVQQNGQGASESEQPLTLTKGQLDKYIADALAAQKQTWLNEAYQNSQSMNDKFEARVNATVSALEAAGIKVDKVAASKFVREQDKRNATAEAQAQLQRQNQIDPAYSQYLQRFGVNEQFARDERLQGGFALEQEYGIQLMKDDPEYAKYFGDPNKRFNAYQFQRDYEKALSEKKQRTQDNPQANVAGVPSMSGVGRKSDGITNLTSSSDIYDRAIAEMRNQR